MNPSKYHIHALDPQGLKKTGNQVLHSLVIASLCHCSSATQPAAMGRETTSSCGAAKKPSLLKTNFFPPGADQEGMREVVQGLQQNEGPLWDSTLCDLPRRSRLVPSSSAQTTTPCWADGFLLWKQPHKVIPLWRARFCPHTPVGGRGSVGFYMAWG